MLKASALTVENGSIVAFGGDFKGVLSDLSISWEPDGAKYLGITMGVYPYRKGKATLSFQATGTSAATVNFLKTTAYTAVFVSSYTGSTWVDGIGLYGCRKLQSSLSQRGTDRAFVLQGTVQLSFIDYSTTTDGSDRQTTENGTSNNDTGNTTTGADNRWEF